MKRIKHIIVITAIIMLSFGAQAYAKQKQQHNNHNIDRYAPELFYDSKTVRPARKTLSAKKVKGKSRLIKVNSQLLKSDALSITLFDNQVVTAIRDRLIKKVKGSTTWIGYIEGELDSEVFITSRGGAVAGTVRIGQELYEINLAANGQHEISKIDPSQNPHFGDDVLAVDDYGIEDAETSVGFSSQLIANAEINASTIIDVMIVYTQKARSNALGQTGIEAKIVNAVAMANQAYINSQVDMQLNLVHMEEVNYIESGSTSTSLADIRGTSDGKMDSVHALRNQYGADQVVLITADTSHCGTGYIMANPGASFAPYAFSVVHDDSKYACLSNHTLAHELGHNQGDHHDSGSTSSAGAYSYSFGYRLCQTDGFRTVMAYNCTGATRVAHFSNPNVIFNGEYTGTSAANNALSMANTKAIIAAFRGTVDISTPNVPSNLSVLTLSDSEITVSWLDNSNNETGFRLERSINSIDWSEIAVVSSNVTGFTDNGLLAETSYQYRVRAYNSNGNSVFSNIGSGVTEASTTEVCVVNTPSLNVVPNSAYVLAGAEISYQVSLINQDTSSCGISTFSLTTGDGLILGSYSLSAGSSTASAWTEIAPNIDGNFTKSLIASAAEHFNVTKSATVFADGTPPTAPVNLTATLKRKSQVRLSWGASIDTGSGVEHYVVMRNEVIVATTTGTSYTEKPGAGTFVYAVKVFDKVGNTAVESTSITVSGSSGGGRGKGKKR